MVHKAWRSMDEVFYFSVSPVKFQGRLEQKNQRFLPDLSISEL